MGKALFKRNWLPAPSSTKSNDGLGPLFNARSCAQCHAAATAGRITLAPDGDLAETGAVVRLSTDSGAGDPVYGAQVQTHAIPGHAAEASVRVTWEISKVALSDGEVIELRRPRITLSNFASGGLAAGVTPSLLLAPSLSVAAQIARVDIEALRRSGGSPEAKDVSLPFGRKASEASLEDAVALAFSRDLGLSTERHPLPGGDCTARQPACVAGPHGDDGTGIEIAPEIVSAVAAYVQSLSPPVASAAEEINASAEQVFTSASCGQCHRPDLPGKEGEPVRLFSDLARHDLGAGLAGVSGENGVMASSWRTAPLIGIAGKLAAGSTLLHDGRARSVQEAILWHDGDARAARQSYERLSAAERDALHAYIMSR